MCRQKNTLVEGVAAVTAAVPSTVTVMITWYLVPTVSPLKDAVSDVADTNVVEVAVMEVPVQAPASPSAF